LPKYSYAGPPGQGCADAGGGAANVPTTIAAAARGSDLAAPVSLRAHRSGRGAAASLRRSTGALGQQLALEGLDVVATSPDNAGVHLPLTLEAELSLEERGELDAKIRTVRDPCPD